MNEIITVLMVAALGFGISLLGRTLWEDFRDEHDLD